MPPSLAHSNFATNPSDQRILVIGAGFAGLAAAAELQRYGYEVVVLEARDRIGGRVHTLDGYDAPVDLGASWLHGGPGNPLKSLAQTVNIATWETHYETLVVYDTTSKQDIKRHELARWRDELDAFETALTKATLWPAVVTQACRWLRLPGPKIPVSQILRRAKARVALSHEAKDFLAGLVTTYLESDYASRLDTLSCTNLLTTSATAPQGNIFPKGERFVSAGMARLIEHLAAGLTVRLGQRVRRLAYQPGQVIAITDSETFAGQAAVVTLPIGVLRSGDLVFEPALPRGHRRALAGLEMGILNKVVLAFPERFWPLEPELFSLQQARQAVWPWFINLARYAGAPILIATAGGRIAETIEETGDDALISRLLDALRSVFGTAVDEPTQVCVSRWAADPFARGAYSRLALGSTGQERLALSKPIAATVFFAGEALHPHDPGTVHGAYWSGLQAAHALHTCNKCSH